MPAQACVKVWLLLHPVVMAAALWTGPARPYPNNVYDPASARAYYIRRPLQAVGRALEIGGLSAGFGLGLLSDWVVGEEALKRNADQRAAELVRLLTTLGPTFVKVGQSASVRSDLFSPPYLRALTALQEDVPPFSSAEARKIIADEGMAPQLTDLAHEPIAAASLGQVYRARLADGTPVAVKVQRPAIMERIALDMALVREMAPIASLFGVPGDLVGTVDAWGAGFVNELDYRAEALQAEQFNKDIGTSKLAARVFAPRPVREASSARVLTTEWAEGERLDRCSAVDVPRLCSLAMNTYLEMLLGTGRLHCDPHPGNLLRTTDGRLCILDWGLVQDIDPSLRLTLIEHVAHLTARDYARVPDDLVRLGFVPEGGEAAVRDNGVVELLTGTYSTWASGGGSKKFNIPKLFDKVRSLAADSPAGIFQVPPYFAYIAKAFSVLEGIGLGIDPNYSIVKETLPYISTRIITDPSPRTGGALATFVYGESKDDEVSSP